MEALTSPTSYILFPRFLRRRQKWHKCRSQERRAVPLWLVLCYNCYHETKTEKIRLKATNHHAFHTIRHANACNVYVAPHVRYVLSQKRNHKLHYYPLYSHSISPNHIAPVWSVFSFSRKEDNFTHMMFFILEKKINDSNPNVQNGKLHLKKILFFTELSSAKIPRECLIVFGWISLQPPQQRTSCATLPTCKTTLGGRAQCI